MTAQGKQNPSPSSAVADDKKALEEAGAAPVSQEFNCPPKATQDSSRLFMAPVLQMERELWDIAIPAWDAIEHGLRYEGVTSGPEIIIKAIKKAIGYNSPATSVESDQAFENQVNYSGDANEKRRLKEVWDTAIAQKKNLEGIKDA